MNRWAKWASLSKWSTIQSWRQSFFNNWGTYLSQLVSEFKRFPCCHTEFGAKMEENCYGGIRRSWRVLLTHFLPLYRLVWKNFLMNWQLVEGDRRIGISFIWRKYMRTRNGSDVYWWMGFAINTYWIITCIRIGPR